MSSSTLESCQPLEIKSAEQRRALRKQFRADRVKAAAVQALVLGSGDTADPKHLDADDVDLLWLLPGLKILKIHLTQANEDFLPRLASELQAVPSLQELTFMGLEEESRVDVQSVMSLPNLQQLLFIRCSLRTDGAAGEWSTAEGVLTPLDLLALTNCEIDAKTLDTLLQSRPCREILIRSPLPGLPCDGFLHDAQACVDMIKASDSFQSGQLNRFGLIHDRISGWQGRAVSFADLDTLRFLEISVENLFGFPERMSAGFTTAGGIGQARRMFPGNLEVLSLHVREGNYEFGRMDDFVWWLAVKKAVLAPKLQAIILPRRAQQEAIQMSHRTLATCTEREIEVIDRVLLEDDQGHRDSHLRIEEASQS